MPVERSSGTARTDIAVYRAVTVRVRPAAFVPNGSVCPLPHAMSPLGAETDSVDLSVILCSLNGSETIGAQLEALQRQHTSHSFEVVVVDNGSTDGTADIVRGVAVDDPRFRLVSAPERQNLSYARNVGVAAAQAPAVAFCDDDDLVSDGWVEGLVTALRDSAFVASALEYERLNDAERLVGRSRFQSEVIGQMFGLAVTNGAIAIERALWDSVGGNDEAFGTTGEDFDFAMRVFEETGVRPSLADGAVYHYRLRDGSRGAFRQARRFGRSHAQLYARHGRGRVDVSENTRQALRDWWWITTRAPFALAGVRRENWAMRAGRRVGRLQGSLRFRVLWL